MHMNRDPRRARRFKGVSNYASPTKREHPDQSQVSKKPETNQSQIQATLAKLMQFSDRGDDGQLYTEPHMCV